MAISRVGERIWIGSHYETLARHCFYAMPVTGSKPSYPGGLQRVTAQYGAPRPIAVNTTLTPCHYDRRARGIREDGRRSGALKMSTKHNTIIANAAKIELARLGFRQKGQSRLWLADHQSWLNVVEFTPDRWSKAVSLVNAAHWLWAGTGFLALHRSEQSRQRAQFETGEQFTAAIAKIAQEAASIAHQMQEKFSSFEATAAFVIDRARSSPERMQPSWWGYEAGIAAGLCGDFAAAKTFLNGITDDRVVGHATLLLPLIDDPTKFRSRVSELVAQQREALDLPALGQSPF